MSSTFADEPRAPPPMHGPDLALGALRSWTEHPGAASELVLDDGSTWRLQPRRADYDLPAADGPAGFGSIAGVVAAERRACAAAEPADLLVGIDTVASEVILVQPLPRATAAPAR